MEISILVFIASFFSQAFGSVVGFGAGMLLTPSLLLFFDFQSALFLSSIAHLFGNSTRVYSFKDNLNLRIFLYFLPLSVLFVFLGFGIIHSLDSSNLVRIVSVLLFLYSLFFLFFKKFEIKDKRVAIVIGPIYAFLTTISGFGGVIRAAALKAFLKEKKEFVGTSSLIALSTTLVRLFGYAPYLNFTVILSLVIGSFAGAIAGNKLLSLIPQANYDKVVSLVILAISLHLFFSV